jgi:hypothetical protein
LLPLGALKCVPDAAGWMGNGRFAMLEYVRYAARETR